MYQEIIDQIKKSDRIVITAHKSPDGDSVGSSLGLYRFLRKLGKDVVVCHPDRSPAFLHWLEDVTEILTMEEHPKEVAGKIVEADLIFALDYNGLGRVGEEMARLIQNAQAPAIMIDHHLHPEDFALITCSQPEICSTSQLVYETVVQSDEHASMDAFIATPLYLGMVTDTGSFRFPSVDPRTHRIVAEMIEMGVNHSRIHEQTFDTNTLDRLKLRGYATSEKLELLHNGSIAVIALSEEELKRFNYEKGDTEGLVNVALSIAGVKAAALFSEKDGKIKISFRGKEDYEVNRIASDHFEGGGHKYAAGGISSAPLADTLARFKQLIPDYFA